MKEEIKYRTKVEIGFVFKDIDREDVFYSPGNVIHDLTYKQEGSQFSQPLAAWINSYYTPSGVPVWITDKSKHLPEFTKFIDDFRMFLSQDFTWKKRTVRLTVVEKCPWVYNRTRKLMEITNEDILYIVYSILAMYQYQKKDFVFALMKPILATRNNYPQYPFRVKYEKDTRKLIYITAT